MEYKKKFMYRAIQLAKNGLGTTSPNPMVGCVIEKNGLILSEGWHYKIGMYHAEINAINFVKDLSLLVDSTLYVTLEPCVHFGKTPPCVDLIIKNRIPRVVIGTQDPCDKVNGLGIKKLREYGIEVIENVLKNECRYLNKRFFTFYEKNRPYVILKWAQSYDGFMDNSIKKNSWISGIYSRQLSHKWRSEEDSILVGRKTVINDNPKLNVRKWFGNNPIRIVLDRNLSISDTYFVLDKTKYTIIFTEKKKENRKNTEFVQISFDKKIIKNILNYLYKKKIISLIVEGGKMTLESFIKEKIWDESRIFICNIFLKNGLKSPIISGKIFQKKYIEKDKLVIKIPF
ncbi:bifunctional diaminohydroxyphosphoribosylaminopyrimidine deaminase/5-amino-6-(5-phosphoribosylamino)uracil reductase RibD [Blattabacterium sp. (Cryptocercus punctulatus) str. Cpu]|uniref:bifunctional diaminohydroxyphosphoribosylaminopyrimidine deaminase/5-amino-6-(5-phosphoribosylamino)uracil reductase RibD n=1 Tax=Blattabacterium sp. (Cryptocercus punctulatus) str. Cpu TaxID=1075399 RepID=UPI0002387273|nr:bifunctional diaminohydroxyphosphoribosylaminopyrimidine deaminase/5-amino-6-(5-phosphoribosylamino)uracil reductase RibD [Blattabacterium sp. (Cryptocercus punctulatus) str. Cpu]AEU09198.1 bifunctional diaminohydroxyphosphoribosylaminopyrimidine deaminase, 5-amino-6-(5-phosphoribosylamino)uracil reductase [Blattabacterium sp. (Cryptocercus punctulatus) str. Cpu]